MSSELTIGVDLGGTNTRAGLVDVEGEILGRGRRSTALSDGADAVVMGIAGCIRDAAEDGGINLKNIKGVGIGAPGPLDPYEGVIISPENLQCMHGVRLKDQLEAGTRDQRSGRQRCEYGCLWPAVAGRRTGCRPFPLHRS